MRKLYIHIGAPKCASTSIQKFIFENVPALATRNIAVTDAQLNFGGEGDNPLWFFQNLIQEKPANGSQLVAQRLSAIGNRDAIISAENLDDPSAPYLFVEAAKTFDIRVLHVVRRQDDWVYSAWKQWDSKAGIDLNDYIGQAFKHHWPNFPATVRAWSTIIPRERITVVSLDLLGESTIEDIVLEWLGLADAKSQFFTSPGLQNENFDFRILDLLARHKGVYDDHHDRKIELLLNSFSKLAMQKKYRLPDDFCDKIMDHYHDDNVELLGPARADQLRNLPKKNRLIAEPSQSLEGHDFIIAVLLEAMANMSAQLSDTTQKLQVLERAANRPFNCA